MFRRLLTFIKMSMLVHKIYKSDAFTFEQAYKDFVHIKRRKNMILIKYHEHFLYTNKRDVFYLTVYPSENSLLPNEEFANDHIKWFEENQIHYEKISSVPAMSWHGEYYVDFKGWDDPNVQKYSDKFEADGISLFPKQYQMHCLLYNDWVKSGGIEDYEKFLKHIEKL